MEVTVAEALAAAAGRRQRARVAALAVGLAAVAACALSLAAPPLRGLPMHPAQQIIHVLVTAAYVGAGAVALVRRPGNATGPLMIAVGFLWLISDLAWIPAALPWTVALVYPQLYQPVLAHLALAFPSGRLPGVLERRVLAALYVWTLLNNIVVEMFDDPRAQGCTGCQRNLLLVDSDAKLQHDLSNAFTTVSIVVVIATAALIFRHWWRATRAARYVMEPVLWVVLPAAAFITLQQFGDLITFGPTLAKVVYNYLPLGLALLPIGFLIGLLRNRLAYAHVGSFAAELDGPATPGRVRDVLARMLHDPDLELFYWAPSTREYVDIDGNPRDAAEVSPGRKVTQIGGESGPLALLVVDTTAIGEPGLLRAAESMTRLALENERLQAEVRSQLVQLRQTTGRLVEAGQAARRRIERDLHDGAQQRLIAMSMMLGRARANLPADAALELRDYLENASQDLQQAITELRELARGIHPVLLTSEGLASALQALAERAPLPVHVSVPDQRFAETVESTSYFIVAEAVTNAARHSQARRVNVNVDSRDQVLTIDIIDDGIGGVDDPAKGAGSGLQGMRDRAMAAGGDLFVSSPPGGGTHINVRLPCA